MGANWEREDVKSTEKVQNQVDEYCILFDY